MLSPRAAVDAAQKEEDYQQQIIDLARTLGWRVYHTYDSRRSAHGFPDLILIRGITLLALEVKSAGAKEPPPEQVGWIGAFKQVRRVHADFVYPEHWDDLKDTLQRALR
ncbi:hypothetical protein LCGC14_1711380 [marine sediment metagenome]|uniref:VRR-NUC domain-containing protein n=1 Tax=marine sediment metagenome TaxID=412755 RepID=A0A0F9HFL9_9ZZZZ